MRRVNSGKGYALRCSDKHTREFVDLPIGDRFTLVAALEAHLGKPIYDYVHEEVGDPGFLPDYDTTLDQVKYISTSRSMADYFDKAITRMCESVPTTQSIREISTGLHVVAPGIDPEAGPDDFILYLVNGPVLYKGTFDEKGVLTWVELPGPSDGHIVLQAGPGNIPAVFMPQIKSADDLNRTPKMTAQELYQELLRFIRLGWDFKEQTVTSDLVATLLMWLPIASTGMHQPQIMVTAETQSGKTMLVGGVIGGSAAPRIRLIQSSFFTDNFTKAGTRQSMTNKSLTLALDEVEDKGGNDRRSQQNRETLSQYRGMSNEVCASVQGTTSGQAATYYLRHPLVVSGIRPLHDAADINRYIRIEMDKKNKGDSPQEILLGHYGEPRITQLRHDIPLIMFRLAKQFYTAFRAIEDEFHKSAMSDMPFVSRTRQGLYGILAIKKILGQDYMQYARDYYTANRAHL
jgi:hypothetical protein